MVSDRDSDPGDVIVHSFAGDDALSIKADWRARGLLPRRRDTDRAIDYGVIAKRKAERQQHVAGEDLMRQATARYLWARSQPAEETVQTYLSSHGIDMVAPATVRFLPSGAKNPYPAMITAFGIALEPELGRLTISSESVCGVHLTYLQPNGSGKAPIGPAKRMIGRIKGSPILLAPPNDGLGLLIAEGIETALSGHLGTGLGTWAAGSAGFMPALADAVPGYIECVTIAREPDPAGTRGTDELARRLEDRGIESIMLEAA
jgi:hypothetical protein